MDGWSLFSQMPGNKRFSSQNILPFRLPITRTPQKIQGRVFLGVNCTCEFLQINPRPPAFFLSMSSQWMGQGKKEDNQEIIPIFFIFGEVHFLKPNEDDKRKELCPEIEN